MGEGFGAEEADGGDVSVSGGNEGIRNGKGRGGGFDIGDVGSDLGVWGFGTEETEDLAGRGAVWGF